jgi:hypothetical protein
MGNNPIKQTSNLKSKDEVISVESREIVPQLETKFEIDGNLAKVI